MCLFMYIYACKYICTYIYILWMCACIHVCYNVTPAQVPKPYVISIPGLTNSVENGTEPVARGHHAPGGSTSRAAQNEHIPLTAQQGQVFKQGATKDPACNRTSALAVRDVSGEN